MSKISSAWRALALAGALLPLSTGAAAAAETYRLSFYASGFKDPSGEAAPTDPVRGTIDFTAAAMGAPVISIVAIDLTIDGHQYTLDEVGAYPLQPSDSYYFGNPANGAVNSFRSGTDDFGVGACIVCGSGFPPNQGAFTYTSSRSAEGFWTVNPYFDPTSVFTFSIAAIPEPGIAMFMLAGLVLLSSVIRQRRGASPQG